MGESTFDECVSYIGESTFDECIYYIGESTFDECVYYIGESTFDECVSSIGDSTFDECFSFIGESTFDECVSFIGESTFDECVSFFGESTFDEWVFFIRESTFDECVTSWPVKIVTLKFCYGLFLSDFSDCGQVKWAWEDGTCILGILQECKQILFRIMSFPSFLWLLVIIETFSEKKLDSLSVLFYLRLNYRDNKVTYI